MRQFATDPRPYLTLDDATTCAAAREDPQGFPGDRFLGGVVLYDGIQSLPMGSVAGCPIWALPLASLWQGSPTVAP